MEVRSVTKCMRPYLKYERDTVLGCFPDLLRVVLDSVRRAHDERHALMDNGGNLRPCPVVHCRATEIS